MIAALIGGGGFGTFVFQGIGQTAIDLVLLGAIPTVILSFAASIVLSKQNGVLTHIANQLVTCLDIDEQPTNLIGLCRSPSKAASLDPYNITYTNRKV